ncbi:MAG: hypothetical protein AAF719_00040 [Pseudomonadota bacterium]
MRVDVVSAVGTFERVGPRWTEYGGLETIMSYGGELAELKTDADAWRRIRDAFASRPPDTHSAFFKALKSKRGLGSYIFVHASVGPTKPFEAQTDADFLSVRDDFLLETAQLPFRVVHGHTPQDAPLRTIAGSGSTPTLISAAC